MNIDASPSVFRHLKYCGKLERDWERGYSHDEFTYIPGLQGLE